MKKKEEKKLKIKTSVAYNIVAGSCYLHSGAGATCVMRPY